MRLKEGVQVWESLRAGLGNSDAYKISIFETQLDTYRNLQETLIAQNKVAPALEVAEKSRARAFIELVARHRHPITPPQNIAAPTIEQIRQIARTQNATIVQYSIMRDQFVTTSHGGSVQFTTNPKETAVFIWVIQPNGNVTFRRVTLDPNQTIGELVNTARSTIGARGISVSSARTIFKTGDIVRRKGEPKGWQPYKVVAINSTDRTATLSHPEIKLTKPVSFDELYTATTQQAQFYQFQALHKTLIAPIADLLPKTANEKVVFVPQEKLFLVPFAALQNQKGEFLVEKHTPLTVPAIQLLGLTRRPTGQLGKALIIGNPTPMPKDYAPLPGATKEAQAIGQLLNVSPLIAQSATEASVKSQISQAKTIHFATHGFFDEAAPLQGGIALAPTGQEDGLLTAEEMLKLPLNAELVVLSACDTGRGKITGDGVLGLSRSWLAAGASNLLVSLWAVDDQSTSDLMVNFYQSLKQQPDAAIALRQAMLQTMQKHPAPQDWAAFSLVGSTFGR
jgi:CHAT domain-containing protein